MVPRGGFGRCKQSVSLMFVRSFEARIDDADVGALTVRHKLFVVNLVRGAVTSNFFSQCTTG